MENIQLIFGSDHAGYEMKEKLINFYSLSSRRPIISGVADADEFFTCGKSNMCSYVKKWNSNRYLFLRGREICVFILIWLIEIIIILRKYIPNFITQTTIFCGLKHIFNETYKDIMFKLVI